MCEIDWAGDGHKFWRDERRTARKRHRCDACRSPIEPGQAYVRHVSLGHDDDAPTDEKLCAACDAIMAEFGAVAGHPPRTNPSSLGDFIAECIDHLHDEETMYDEDKDEFVPGPAERHWRAKLDEIDARRGAARTEAP